MITITQAMYNQSPVLQGEGFNVGEIYDAVPFAMYMFAWANRGYECSKNNGDHPPKPPIRG